MTFLDAVSLARCEATCRHWWSFLHDQVASHELVRIVHSVGDRALVRPGTWVWRSVALAMLEEEGLNRSDYVDCAELPPVDLDAVRQRMASTHRSTATRPVAAITASVRVVLSETQRYRLLSQHFRTWKHMYVAVAHDQQLHEAPLQLDVSSYLYAGTPSPRPGVRQITTSQGTGQHTHVQHGQTMGDGSGDGVPHIGSITMVRLGSHDQLLSDSDSDGIAITARSSYSDALLSPSPVASPLSSPLSSPLMQGKHRLRRGRHRSSHGSGDSHLRVDISRSPSPSPRHRHLHIDTSGTPSPQSHAVLPSATTAHAAAQLEAIDALLQASASEALPPSFESAPDLPLMPGVGDSESRTELEIVMNRGDFVARSVAMQLKEDLDRRDEELAAIVDENAKQLEWIKQLMNESAARQAVHDEMQQELVEQQESIEALEDSLAAKERELVQQSEELAKEREKLARDFAARIEELHREWSTRVLEQLHALDDGIGMRVEKIITDRTSHIGSLLADMQQSLDALPKEPATVPPPVPPPPAPTPIVAMPRHYHYHSSHLQVLFLASLVLLFAWLAVGVSEREEYYLV